MAAKKSAALEFTRSYLRHTPEASFAEIRDAAQKEDLKIYPIVFGRAKALEGLVKVAPYGSKKREREARASAANAAQLAAAAGEGSVQPGRENAEDAESERPEGGRQPRTTVDSIHAVIAGMRENHQDREKYRAALIKISEILDEVL